MKRYLTLLMILLPLLCISVIRQVSLDGSQAYTSIQTAINDAVSGDIVLVHQGRYLEILSYNQYNAIQKFIHDLLKIGCSDKDIKRRNKIHPSLAQMMNGIDRIDDWGITMADNRRFRLHIFHLTQDNQAIGATFLIVMNERNHVSVENCKKNEIIGSHPIPANIHIPKEMGKSLWTYEKIISLINA